MTFLLLQHNVIFDTTHDDNSQHIMATRKGEEPELWPFHKVEQNLAALDASLEEGARPPPLCILLTTGALNPLHKGHISMHHKASEALAKSFGFRTVGTFLSPSNDMYLEGKYGKGKFIPGAIRTQCVDAAVADDTLISTGRWETAQEGHWPDFPVVAKDLHESVQARFKDRHIMVLYVCGEDHYNRCGLSRGMRPGIGLCVVARDGRCGATNKDRNIYAIDTEDETSDFSSTKVRKLLKACVVGGDKDGIALELQAFVHEGVAKFLVEHLAQCNVRTLA